MEAMFGGQSAIKQGIEFNLSYRKTKMADINAIAEQIQGLTLLEASQLVKLLEEKLGVSAAAAAVAAAPAGGGAAAAAPVEEKTEFTVVLTAVGANKINVIKVVREVTSLGLKEAKDLVDGAPKPDQGRREQGRSRDHQEEVRRCWRHRRSEVVGPESSRVASFSIVGRGHLTRPADLCYCMETMTLHRSGFRRIAL